MKTNKPIVEALRAFVTKVPYSLHVPGHKNGLLSALPNEIKQALKYDVTELTGLDDFHHPEEAIQEAQLLLAEAYGSEYSYFLVNGSTVGNLAMIYATVKKDEQVIVQRNAHKSIFHALQLVGAVPIFVSPEWHQMSQTAACVSFEKLKDAVDSYPDAKAIVLTYPTYYGITARDIERQIQYCHERNIPVLVDEAHGAHFAASRLFPTSALAYGADVVVQSAHKTLPAMTMASFLHVNSKLVNVEKVNMYLRMLQSSSPSYLLMASLDEARHYVQTYRESDATYLLEKRAQWIDALKAIGMIEIVEVDDPLKLLMRVKDYTGFQLQKVLEEQNVYVELADAFQVLIILPLLKHGQVYSFADLRICIKEAITKLMNEEKKVNKENDIIYPIATYTKSEISYAELETSDKEWLPYMRTIGKVAASMLIPYPPGIPLLIPGEKITVAKLSQLEELIAVGTVFQGNHRLTEKMIEVIKE
ncbi:MAG: aminotransferase class I/II-fold pyridoxal phosphate-dependent enzyme [Lysinibacillus sp.]